jgi:hypothetical protein
VEIVNDSNPAALARARAAPSHFSDPSAAGNQVTSLRVLGDEADKLQTFLMVPYLCCLCGERLHLDYGDVEAFHFY